MEKATFLRGPTWHQITTGEAKMSQNTRAILQGGYQEDWTATTTPANQLPRKVKGVWGSESFRSTRPSVPRMTSSSGSNWTSSNFGRPANGSVNKEGALFNSAPKVPAGNKYQAFARNKENATMVGKPNWLEISRGKKQLSRNTRAVLQGGYQEDMIPYMGKETAAFQHNNYSGNVPVGDRYASFRRNSKETFNHQRGPLGSAKRPYYYQDFPRFSNYIPRSYETTYPVYSFRRY